LQEPEGGEQRFFLLNVCLGCLRNGWKTVEKAVEMARRRFRRRVQWGGVPVIIHREMRVVAWGGLVAPRSPLFLLLATVY
jgi:hypothetical protein